MSDENSSSDPAAPAQNSRRLIVMGLLLTAFVVAYTQFGGALSLQNLAARESQLRQYQADQPLVVFAVAFLIYVTATGLSLPGAVVLTLVFSWYFGFIGGLVLVSFASTAGATVAFLLSRYLFRDAIQQRFGERLSSFSQSLEREGPFFLFTLRLIPAVPFFIINAVMGLTLIRTSTFWWISQIGMLPGTAIYVYAGSSVPNLSTLAEKGIGAVFSPAQLTKIFFAFVLLGLFPLIVRFVMSRFQPRTIPPATADSAEDSP